MPNTSEPCYGIRVGLFFVISGTFPTDRGSSPTDAIANKPYRIVLRANPFDERASGLQ